MQQTHFVQLQKLFHDFAVRENKLIIQTKVFSKSNSSDEMGEPGEKEKTFSEFLWMKKSGKRSQLLVPTIQMLILCYYVHIIRSFCQV